MTWLACAVAWGFRLPFGHPRVDQWHALILASSLLLLVRGVKPSPWTVVAAWALPVVFVWPDPYGLAWLWLATWVLVCLAVGQCPPAEVRRAVLWCGVLQLPLALLELAGHPVFETIGGHLGGSLGRRYLLSALWGLCALWSTGWRQGAWLLAAMCTTSWVGVVPVIVAWSRRRPWLLIGLLPLLWWGRISWQSRHDAWQMVTWWPPRGFKPFPTGFVGDGAIEQLLQWRDYHSAVIELWVRFGPWALLGLLGLSFWVWRRAREVAVWLLCLAGLQSVEAYPAAAWLMAMAIQGGRNGADSVQKA